MMLEITKRSKSICLGVLSIIFVLIALVVEELMPSESRHPIIYGIFTLLSWFAAATTGILAIIIGRSVKCKSGVICGRIGVGLSAFFFMMSLVGFLLTISTDRIPCQLEMQRLSRAIQQYCKQNEGFLPDAEVWCDQLLESVEYPNFFHITGENDYIYDTPVVKKSDFAFNSNLDGHRPVDIDRQIVLLFETDCGWNQNGTSDILLKKGHSGYRAFIEGGSHFVFVGPDSTLTIKFIKNSKIDSLNWVKQGKSKLTVDKSGFIGRVRSAL